jgi:hypothetical protein
MKVEQLMEFLEGSEEDVPVSIAFPGREVPAHFHVTEIGRVEKVFVDCGGALRMNNYCSMQIWVANDVDHRITPKKLHDMICKSEALVSLNDLPVMIEYGEEVVSLYELKDVRYGRLYMEPKKAECLAPEVCGVEVLENKCCSGDGCC